MRRRAARTADPELQPRELTGPVFIAGMGRTGRTLADALTEFDIGYGAIERDQIDHTATMAGIHQWAGSPNWSLTTSYRTRSLRPAASRREPGGQSLSRPIRRWRFDRPDPRGGARRAARPSSPSRRRRSTEPPRGRVGLWPRRRRPFLLLSLSHSRAEVGVPKQPLVVNRKSRSDRQNRNRSGPAPHRVATFPHNGLHQKLMRCMIEFLSVIPRMEV